MATSNVLRRAALVSAGTATYVGVVYITYQFMIPPKGSDHDEKSGKIAEHSSSFVNDPKRSKRFESIASSYDDEIGRDEQVMGINLLRRSLLYFNARGKVLEVGAGTGRNLDYYPLAKDYNDGNEHAAAGDASGKVTKVILTDSSDKMLQQAKEKLQLKSKGTLWQSANEAKKQVDNHFETHVADAAHLTMYDDDSFDTIVDTFGLCSFDDPVKVLNEMQRVCNKNGGKILLLEHGRSKTYEGLSNYLDKNAERHAKNWGCVWNRDIDSILDEAGLEIETKRTWHFGTTYYVVCKPKKRQSMTQNKILALSADHGECFLNKHCSTQHMQESFTNKSSLIRSTMNKFFLLYPISILSQRRECHHCHRATCNKSEATKDER